MKNREIIKVNMTKQLILRRVWRTSAWMYEVKKYSLLFFLLSIPGWKDEPGIHTTVDYFPTIEEARAYALKIKNNYLAG